VVQFITQNKNCSKPSLKALSYPISVSSLYFPNAEYSHVPRNDVSVNNGPHIRWGSHKIIIMYVI